MRSFLAQREFSVAAVLVILLTTLAIAQPVFFQSDKALNVLVSAAPILVAAIGMTLVIVSREIDISIGSILSICGVVAGLLSQAGWPIAAIVPATMLAGALLGAVNGALIGGLKLPSIVVTLATMVTWREALRWYREGVFVTNLRDDFQWFGLGQQTGQRVLVLLAFGLLIVGGICLTYTAAGRLVYAVGSDREASRLVGIRPYRVVFGVFVLMGALCGLAALMNAVRFAQVDPKDGEGLELQVIAAVVIGGAAVSGGRGTLWGTCLGVLLLTFISPALVFLHVETHWEKSLQGAIILLAITSEALLQRTPGAKPAERGKR